MRCLIGLKDFRTGAPFPVPCEGVLQELRRLDALPPFLRRIAPGMWRENGICLEEVSAA